MWAPRQQRPASLGGSRGTPHWPWSTVETTFGDVPLPLSAWVPSWQVPAGGRAPAPTIRSLARPLPEHQNVPPLLPQLSQFVPLSSGPPCTRQVSGISPAALLRGAAQSSPSPPASPPAPWCSSRGCTSPSSPVGRGQQAGVLGPGLGQQNSSLTQPHGMLQGGVPPPGRARWERVCTCPRELRCACARWARVCCLSAKVCPQQLVFACV